MRVFYAERVATGPKFEFGEQRPALISGDLALTSTLLPDGSVTSECPPTGRWHMVMGDR
jgi:hypothetical protein